MNDIFINIISGFNLIGESLIKDTSNFWVLIPILILWLVMEFYFGEYKQEKMGWNTALANGISFTWINIAAFRFLFSEVDPLDFQFRLIVLSLFFLYGTFIIFFSFSHLLSQKFAYTLGGPTMIYFLSMVATLVGSGTLTLTRWVFVDLVIILAILIAILYLIKKYLLGFWGEVEAVKAGKTPEEIK